MTRKDMAMRWSRWVATSPPPGTLPPSPCTRRSSPSIACGTPAAARPAATAASRSDSLTLSSCRPRMRVVPSAKAAATARTGYSSIIDGARCAGTSTPASRLAPTRRSATVSPPSSRSSRRSISAPISRRVARSPVRSGFIITPSMTTSEPGTISAATSGNAAEDGSDGTTTGLPRASAGPRP